MRAGWVEGLGGDAELGRKHQDQDQHQNPHRKHPPFAKAAKDGAPAKTGAGIGRVVEWYHSHGSAVNSRDYECELRKDGPPANWPEAVYKR